MFEGYECITLAMDVDLNYTPISDGLMAFGICDNATQKIIDKHKNYFFSSII